MAIKFFCSNEPVLEWNIRILTTHSSIAAIKIQMVVLEWNRILTIHSSIAAIKIRMVILEREIRIPCLHGDLTLEKYQVF